MFGGSTASGTLVPGGDEAIRPIPEPLNVVADGGAIGRHLLEGFGLHEMPELAVVVEVLHISTSATSAAVDRFTRLEGALDGAAILEIADAHAAEGLALAGLDELVSTIVAGSPSSIT